jgi:hypothetical protein
MTERLTKRAIFAAAAMLAACSQGQSGPSATPETPAYGTSTGELACDEYVAHANACIEKGRFGALNARRSELKVVERTLRDFVGGKRVELDRNAVWVSAVRVARTEKRLASLLEKVGPIELAPSDAPVDTMPATQLCRRAIDQLPAECQ